MMKPLLFLSVIGGGMSGSFIFQLMDAGLRAPASPGSIIAILAMTPFNSYLPVILGVIVAAAVSFGISAVILKADAKDTNEDFEKSVQETKAAKQASKGAQVFLKELHSLAYKKSFLLVMQEWDQVRWALRS